MMKKPKKASSDIAEALSFPKKGDTLEGTKVLEAKYALEKGTIFRYEILFPKGTRAKAIPSLLSTFFNTQMVGTERSLIVRHHDYAVKARSTGVAVIGAMHVVPVALANPGMQEFDEDYSKMEMTNPETYFRAFDCKNFSAPQMRAKLFSLVSYMGENYGYYDGEKLYHRRASLIMPKIKITKAVKNAKMMYHTHPSRDEPSLSSAEDYLLYFDLSHKPRSIRDFYTIMADRLDHFKITPKKGSKKNFLKVSEDKFIDEANAKIDDLEKKWSKKYPKESSNDDDDLRYCEAITKDLVAWLNQKYGSMFTIQYKCHYKVKKNPPKMEADDLHMNDEFLKRAIVDISSRDYGWPVSDSKIEPHEEYAYWHQRYYTMHLKDTYMTLGVNLQPAEKRVSDAFMARRFADSVYSNEEALNLLNLSHDISMSDRKVRDGGGYTSRLEELCAYFGITEEALETLTVLQEVIREHDIFGETAQTLSGDYYPLALLSYYSINAVEVMKKVKRNELDLEIARLEIYNKLKQRIGDTLGKVLIVPRTRNPEIQSHVFVDSLLNPPVHQQSVEALTQFPPQAFEFPDIIREALDEFDPAKYDPTKKLFGEKQLILRVRTKNGMTTMMIYRRTGTAQIKAPTIEDAMEAAQKVNRALYTVGARGVKLDEDFTISLPDVAKNPSEAQVITISGPSGSGKSTMTRNLLKMLPNAKTIPSITTRQRRRSDKVGEKIHVSPEAFKKMMTTGELVAVQLQKNGHYYGKRRSDFKHKGYIIIDVSLSGFNALKKTFPGLFSIYLEPVEDPKTIEQRLIRRGDISVMEAKGRAQNIPSHIESSKKIDFDARILTRRGQFDKASLTAFQLIPKKNPDTAEGRLSDLTMLATHTVEELDNPDDLPTIQQCADSVTRENFLGGGAFGKVFEIPGTNYLFKVNKRSLGDSKGIHPEWKKLIEYLDGKIDSYAYQTVGVTRYRVDYGIPFEVGQPRAWLKRENGGPEPDTVMNKVKGYTIASKIPQARYEGKDKFKQRQQALRGEKNFYPEQKIDAYYEHVENISKMPQENVNELVRQMAYLISKGIPQDIHSGNMIYDVEEQKITLVDWFWDEQQKGGTVYGNSPSMTGLFERTIMVQWQRGMLQYFEDLVWHDRFSKAHDKVIQAKEPFKKQVLLWLDKVVAAFEANKVKRGRYDYINSFFSGTIKEGESYEVAIRRAIERPGREQHGDFEFVDRGRYELLENPKKDLFDWFEDWAKLINMKNKELKTFLDSDWGKVAGLSPEEAKKLGINSGRTSGRRILAMRKKLGLGGPKDYIKGPRHLEDMYAKAIDNWTGPATKKGTDWYWCTRQVRFNKRFMGDNFGERKGPLVKKQKTQNQPSRRLLSLWVWGHDPWRYARKNGVNRMPKCPDVPWVGRTEKIKYGKIEVIPGPRKNPPVKLVSRAGTDDNVSRFFNKKTGEELTGKVFDSATIDTKGGVSLEVGEETSPIELVGVKRQYNVAKLNDRGVVQVDGGSNRLFEKIDFKLPVHLEHDPMSLGEPSAFISTRGVLIFDKSEDNYTLVKRNEITDWQGGSKSDSPLLVPLYKYAKVVKRTPGEHGRPVENPMAPGYQSYGWTTQDWRSIKVNNKGEIDYSQKCGAEGTKTPSGSPRLCLPAAVVKSLIRTDSGKDVIRTQARKKARAKKGERVPWHPRIKKIWKRIEDKTVKDRPKSNPPVDKVWVRNAKRQVWTEEGTLDFMGLESAPYESFTYRYYIYEAENKLAFAEITHTPEERKVRLDLIGVADDARGKKYGEALLARIKDDHPGHTITLVRSSRSAIEGVENILGRRASPVPDDVLKGWYQRNGFRALMSEVGKPVWGTSEQGRRKIISRGEERESARMVAINPPEWRHGEFSEEDPFEEYF